MSLLKQVTKEIARPGQIYVLYGHAGLGKTEQACKLHGLSKTLFLNLEDGYHDGIKGVDVYEREKLPDLATIETLINELATTKHHYRCVVIDSETALLPYFYARVTNSPVGYAEDADYAKNHKKVAEEKTRFMKKLQALKPLGIDVIITAHEKVYRFNDPKEDKAYDRYRVATPYEDIADAVCKFADNVGFCRYKTELTSDGKFKAKADSDGERVIQFEWRPWAPDAKNRLGLGYEVPMDKDANGWRIALAAGANNAGKSADQLRTEINQLLPKAPQKTQLLVAESVKAAGDNTAELSRIKEKLYAAVSSLGA